MWGDFCKKSYDDHGNEVGLELNTYGYDMTDPNVQVPMSKKTIIPDPEKHFSFSAKLMVLAIDLYQDEAPKDLSIDQLCSQKAQTVCRQQEGHDSSILQILRGACLQLVLPT